MEIKENEIKIAKIRETAVVPTKRAEDAGFDLYADFEEDFYVIDGGKSRMVPTGIATAFPSKYYAQVEERSSLAKLGIKKSGGVFDSGYRGEYMIILYNTNDKPFIISKVQSDELDEEFEVNGIKYNKQDVILYPKTKAICQVVMHEVPTLETKEVTYEELLSIPSERGTGGFGSSKK